MFEIKSTVQVNKISGEKISDFLINCDDEQYQKWWPGTHMACHTLNPTPNHIGQTLFMDEYIGTFRIKMKAQVINYIPGEIIYLQLQKIFKLPVYLIIKFKNKPQGVEVHHTIQAGFKGFGRLFDNIFRLAMPPAFEKNMDEHCQYEFKQLENILNT